MEKFFVEDNKKIAHQFVLISFRYFKCIEARECLGQNWKKHDKQKRAPNILAMINQFNSVSNWISVTILNASSAKQRAKWVNKWVRIGELVFDFHDFQTLGAIHGALSSAPIYRLKKMWKKVDKLCKVKLEEFRVIYDSRAGWSNLRKIHRETKPPMIPYAGSFLNVFYGIDEGNKNTKADGSVNFSKLMRLHTHIQRLHDLQKSSFDNLECEFKLQEFLKTCISKYSHLTETQLYAKSTVALNRDDPKRVQRKSTVHIKSRH